MSKRFILVLIILLLTSSFAVLVKPVYGDAFTGNSWVARAAMPTNSYGGQAAVVDGKIYVIGGFSSANNVYDPSADTWTALKTTPNFVSMNGAMIYQNVIAYQNKIYYIGANATEVYYPSTDSWESKTPMPIGVAGSANIVNGEIYVISGYNYPSASQLLGINQVYNVENDSWTTKASIPYPVSAYASTVCDNKIYIIGGQDPDLGTNSMNVNFTQIYDPVNNSWSFGAPMPTKVSVATACATTGIMATKAVYLFGGYVDSDFSKYSASNLTQIYNPENNSWSYGASMLSPRVEFAAANVNDTLYVLGGSNVGLGAPYILSNEQYFPLSYGTPDQIPTTIPSATRSVPEFSWLAILPLFVSLLFVAIKLRHQKTISQNKPNI
jgi:N-acetylneuraminic acid mutarotase